MPHRRTHRSIITILLLIGIASAGFLCALPAAKAATGVAPSAVRPVEIDIPAIGKKIPLIDVGVTPAGDLDVPHNFVQAGWYEYGAIPGARGSAVIDGHVDNGGYSPTVAGVFKQLDKVVPGNTITVRLSDGTKAAFKVTSTAIYDDSLFPSQQIFDQNDGSYLKIITCHGTWIPAERTYSQRLVVTAERIA